MKICHKLRKPGIICLFLIIILLISVPGIQAQKYVTKNGVISFHSETPIETIFAENHQVNAAMDAQSGDIVFKILMKSFEFPKALMQEHFNENYIESDKYPNATFKGRIVNIKDIDFSKEGSYDAVIEGEMTIHGVTNTVREKGTFKVGAGDKIKGESKFTLAIADYKIKIPKAVTENIADSVDVNVNIDMDKL